MKHLTTIILVLIILIGGLFLFSYQGKAPSSPDTMTQALPVITPIQHASFRMDWSDTVIYADPAQGDYTNQPAADLVLLTDIHGDHLQPDILQQLVTDETVIVMPRAVADELPDTIQGTHIVVNNGETVEQLGYSIEAIPMYNLPESDDAYHVKGRGNGYIVERDGTRVYIAGDTEDIPEMRELRDIDIAFVPMNLPYTMTVQAAADGVLAFAPKIVYPYHYRGTDGLSDIGEFERIVTEENSGITVVKGEWY